jgi:uncharacterized repeat protein (TIGR03803 family)
MIAVAAVLSICRIAAAQAPATVVHSFVGYGADYDSGPAAPLILASDGNFYGSTQRQGTFNQGTLFRMTPSGAVAVLHSFTAGADGAFPAAALVQAADGYLYGTTSYGGPHGYGVAFRVALDGRFSILHGFYRIEGIARSAFIQAHDGNLYATARYGELDTEHGAVFRMTTDGDVTVLHAFAGGLEGVYPSGALVEAADGALYGITTEGGNLDRGTAFRMTLDGQVTILHQFRGGNGDAAYPKALVRGRDGSFYGISAYGGAYCDYGDSSFCGPGTAFRMTPDGAVTLLQTFWSSPQLASGLTAAFDGTFYIVLGEAAATGSILRMASTGEAAVLHPFAASDGAYAQALAEGADGTLYGTATAGGPYIAGGRGSIGFGTIFTVSARGDFSVLVRFQGSTEGAYPAAPPIQATDGNFYGTTYGGGVLDCGTIYRMTPSGATTVLHTFACAIDGGQPTTGLIQATDGSLYGVTSRYGLFDAGVVFRMTLDGAFSTLHAFNREDGSDPQALIQAADGNFYGTTAQGGAFNLGTVFRMMSTGQVRSIHVFDASTAPYYLSSPSALIEGNDGFLYGAAGTAIFRLTRDGAFGILAQTIGGYTQTLVQGSDGSLYGASCFQLFRVTLTGTFSELPNGGLCESSDYGPDVVRLTPGRQLPVYGTTSAYGQLVIGVSSDSSTAVLHELDTLFDPKGVNVAHDGLLYGAAQRGGTFSSGAVFRVDVRVPLQPTTVVAAPGALNSVRVTWAPVAGATSYTVTRLVNGLGTVIATGMTQTHFVDSVTMRPGDDRSYIVTAVNASGASLGSTPLELPWGAAGSRTPTVMLPHDYDGDHKADLTVYRSVTGSWYTFGSATHTTTSVIWGAQDRPVPADYDGDGKTDVAVYRETTGEWFIERSATHAIQLVPFGAPALGDLPVPADYDGDGRADPAVYRSTTGEWFILQSSTQTVRRVVWGAPALGDLPVPADYDGDGRVDVAIYRGTTGEWFVWQSGSGTMGYTQWGSPNEADIPLPADYDGDGRADVAVYRSLTGEWFLNQSTAGLATIAWGAPQAGDVPVPADYDGDGRTDLAVYRFSTAEWFILEPRDLSLGMFVVVQTPFGQAGNDSVRAY